MSEFPVAAPPGISSDETERILRHVAAEFGALIRRREVLDEPPGAVRYAVRGGGHEGGGLTVTVAPARVWVAVDERLVGPWAEVCAAPFARRLGELLGDI